MYPMKNDDPTAAEWPRRKKCADDPDKDPIIRLRKWHRYPHGVGVQVETRRATYFSLDFAHTNFAALSLFTAVFVAGRILQRLDAWPSIALLRLSKNSSLPLSLQHESTVTTQLLLLKLLWHTLGTNSATRTRTNIPARNEKVACSGHRDGQREHHMIKECFFVSLLFLWIQARTDMILFGSFLLWLVAPVEGDDLWMWR